MSTEDTYMCGHCQEAFTSMEEFARHKYVEHGLRFTLIKSFSQKPQIFYPELVPHKRAPAVKKDVKARNTFSKQLVEMEKSGEQKAGISKENQCKKCSRSFRNEKSLLAHQKNSHQVYRCDQCPEVQQGDIIGEEAYNKHMMIHFYKYDCKFCDKKYTSIEGMESHMKLKHMWRKKSKMNVKNANNKFMCPKCGMKSLDDEFLERHLEEVHGWKNIGLPQELPENITFVVNVPETPETESTSQDCHDNQQTDNTKNQQESSTHLLCYVCEQVFHDVVVFTNHLVGQHITFTPHRCGSCEFSSSRRVLLASHMFSEHNQQLPPNPRLDALIIKHATTEESETPHEQADDMATSGQVVPTTVILIDPKVINDSTNTGDTQELEKQLDHLGKELASDSNVVVSINTSIDPQGDRSDANKEQTTDVNNSKEKRLLLALDQLTAVQMVLCNQEAPAPAPAPETEQQATQDQREPKLWLCSICGHSCSTKSHLKVHSRKHTGERPFMCHICNRFFTTKDTLNKHAVSHSSERRFKCGECGKLFKRMAHVRIHLQHTHSTDKPHVCRVCNKYFKTRTSFTTHRKFTHTQERPHICPTCHKSFKTSWTLQRHLLSHGDRQYKCEDCGRAFFHRSVLSRHKKSKVPCKERDGVTINFPAMTQKQDTSVYSSGGDQEMSSIVPNSEGLQVKGAQGEVLMR